MTTLSISIPAAELAYSAPAPAYEIAIRVNAQTQVVYVLDLVRPSGETTRLPMSSFQSRHSTGNLPWLAAYVPGGMDTFLGLADHLDGQSVMVVSKGYRYADGSASAETEIARATLTTPTLSQGARNSTMTLSGYGASVSNNTPRDVQPVGAQIFDYGTSSLRMRASAETVARPGDRLNIGTTSTPQWVTLTGCEYVVTTELQYVDLTVEIPSG